MKARLSLILTGSTGAGLGYLYASATFLFLVRVAAWPNTFLVGVVFLQFVKAAAFVGVPQLRNRSRSLVFDVFFAETLLLAILGATGIATGDPGYFQLALGVTEAWATGLLLLLPFGLLYRFTKQMYRGAKLSWLLPASASLFALGGLLLVAAEGWGSVSDPLGELTIAGRELFGLSGAKAVIVPFDVGVVAVVILISLILYSSKTDSVGELDPRVLFLALLGGAGALIWAATLGEVVGNSVLLLTIPTVAATGAIWWATRGR